MALVFDSHRSLYIEFSQLVDLQRKSQPNPVGFFFIRGSLLLRNKQQISI